MIAVLGIGISVVASFFIDPTISQSLEITPETSTSSMDQQLVTTTNPDITSPEADTISSDSNDTASDVRFNNPSDTMANITDTASTTILSDITNNSSDINGMGMVSAADTFNDTTVSSGDTSVSSGDTSVSSGDTSVPSRDTSVQSNDTSVLSKDTSVLSNDTTDPYGDTSVPSGDTTDSASDTTDSESGPNETVGQSVASPTNATDLMTMNASDTKHVEGCFGKIRTATSLDSSFRTDIDHMSKVARLDKIDALLRKKIRQVCTTTESEAASAFLDAHESSVNIVRLVALNLTNDEKNLLNLWENLHDDVSESSFFLSKYQNLPGEEHRQLTQSFSDIFNKFVGSDLKEEIAQFLAQLSPDDHNNLKTFGEALDEEKITTLVDDKLKHSQMDNVERDEIKGYVKGLFMPIDSDQVG